MTGLLAEDFLMLLAALYLSESTESEDSCFSISNVFSAIYFLW